MKYQDAVADIMKNPTKIFTSGSTGRAYTIGADELGFLYVIIDRHIVISEDIFIANVHARDLDWHEVKQPVTWQEAIQAWAEGRKIRCECRGGTWTYYLVATRIQEMVAIEDGHGVSPSEIAEGTWYIED